MIDWNIFWSFMIVVGQMVAWALLLLVLTIGIGLLLSTIGKALGFVVGAICGWILWAAIFLSWR